MKFPFSNRRRLAPLAGLGALALLLSACSPGVMVATVSGSTTSPTDHLVAGVVCRNPGPTSNTNCAGAVVATVAGKSLTATSMIGGFEDANGNDCVQYPCGPGGYSLLFGVESPYNLNSPISGSATPMFFTLLVATNPANPSQQALVLDQSTDPNSLVNYLESGFNGLGSGFLPFAKQVPAVTAHLVTVPRFGPAPVSETDFFCNSHCARIILQPGSLFG